MTTRKWIEVSNDELLAHYNNWQKMFGKDALKDYFFFIAYAVPEDWKIKEGVVYKRVD